MRGGAQFGTFRARGQCCGQILADGHRPRAGEQPELGWCGGEGGPSIGRVLDGFGKRREHGPFGPDRRKDMNEQERVELERLKERQARLENELRVLSAQLTTFEKRLNQPASEPRKAAAHGEPQAAPQTERPATYRIGSEKPAWTPAPLQPMDKPPVIATAPKLSQSASTAPAAQPASPAPQSTPHVRPQVPASEPLRKGACENCSGHIEFPASALGSSIPCPHCGLMTRLTTEPKPAPPVPPPVSRPATVEPTASGSRTAAPAPAGKGSLEMRVGTYWLVRVGIVLVVTGLVFFGSLAYQNYISKFGPGGKLTLLYLASFALLGVGLWCQRKAERESLKNFGQVVFAGGLAAVYFATYAGYYYEPLRVFPNAGFDGVLLLAWAGFMVWVADRKKSEVLALFAVGLGYYTSIITHVGLFTLYSNLVLTLAAVVFLVRNRWAALSLASLFATYGAYVGWRFFYVNNGEWHWPAPEDQLWTGTYFLMCYWAMFTSAVFFSKHEKLAGPNRAAFLTLNNGAFFTLFLLTMIQTHTGRLWEFALIYGSVLLVLSELARHFLSAEPAAKNAYMTQGLLLVTLGFILEFSGMNLALVLAVESTTLLLVGQQRQSRLIHAGACISALLAVGWGIDGMKPFDTADMWLGIGLGALMLFNTFLAHRHAKSQTALLRTSPSYFVVLALVAGLTATWDNTTQQNFPLVLTGEAAALIFSIYGLRVREIGFFGMAYLALAQLFWTGEMFVEPATPLWWNPLCMLAIALGVNEWWQRQNLLPLRTQTDPSWRTLELLPVLVKNLVLVAATHVAVLLAGGWSIEWMVTASPGLYVPMVLGAMLLADALLADRRQKEDAGLRIQPSFSTVLSLLVWLFVTWHHTARHNFPLAIAAEGLLLTFSFYLLRVREISLFGQGYVLLAQAAWILDVLDGKFSPPWWNPVLLIVLTVVLSHWWQKQKVLSLKPELAATWQALYALAVVGMLYFWISVQVSAPAWLVLTSLLALSLTVYGVLTRAWWLAVCGQLFVVVSGVQFLWQLAQNKPGWAFPLAPLAALALLSFGTVAWFSQKPEADARVRQPLLQIAVVYRWTAVAMSLCWIWQYIPARERIWLLALLGLWFFVISGWRRSREALLCSATFTAAGLVLFWVPGLLDAPTVYWPNLGAILLLPAQRQAARRLPERYAASPAVHSTAIIIGGLTLWLFFSKWAFESHETSCLTAIWSALALVLFSVGIALRERMYRWLGLGILACALGWVVVFDVWKLEMVYRVLSFMALGVVLLVLGFIYNKYQEKLKEWL